MTTSCHPSHPRTPLTEKCGGSTLDTRVIDRKWPSETITFVDADVLTLQHLHAQRLNPWPRQPRARELSSSRVCDVDGEVELNSTLFRRPRCLFPKLIR